MDTNFAYKESLKWPWYKTLAFCLVVPTILLFIGTIEFYQRAVEYIRDE